MADIVDAVTRSRMMARIRSANTLPERTVRQFLHRRGFRFRIHSGLLPGKPDVVLKKYKVAVFVNGCFWHQHRNCPYAYMPVQNRRMWVKKFRDTELRDRRASAALRSANWLPLVIWECQCRNPRALERLVDRIEGNLNLLEGQPKRRRSKRVKGLPKQRR